MIRCTSMKDDGHEWQMSSGIALSCFERLCTKCMRKECVAESSVTEGTVMFVRN